MFKYVIVLVGITVFVGGIVPFAQYIYFTFFLKKSEKLLFSQALLDYDMDNIKYEDIHTQDASLVGRQALANRGWVRCPNGTVMNEAIFEDKKSNEYKIELP